MPENDRPVGSRAALQRTVARSVLRGGPTIGFLALHVAGAIVTWLALRGVWRFRLLFELLAGRAVLGIGLHVPWFLTPVGLIATLALAATEAGRIVRRWWRKQPEPDVLLRLRAALYVAMGCLAFDVFWLSTAESFKGPFRVRFPVTAQVTLAFAYGAYALWSLALPWLRRRLPGRLRRGLDVLAMNLVLLLVVSEIALRVLATFWSSPILVTEASPSRIRRDAGRQQPGTLLFGFPLNSGGHNDSEFAPPSPGRDTVVVSIGDSFSYGSVPHAFHFTTVAEQALHQVDFYNMGYPGLGPTDYFFLLQHDALPLRPDLVVVQLFVGNDVDDGPAVAGPKRWYDADSYLLAIVLHRVRIQRRAEQVDLARVNALASETPAELTVQYPWLADPFREPPGMRRDLFLQVEVQRALGICQPSDAYNEFFRALDDMGIVAGDVPLAFVVIPDEFQVEDDLWEEVERKSGRTLDRDLAQRLIGKWAHSHGRAVLDLLPLLRADDPLKDGRRHLYHLQDTHFNARGNAVAGRALARFADSLLAATADQRAGAHREATQHVPFPLHLDPGDSTASRFMRSGWNEGETAGGARLSWSEGARSVLAVPLPTGSDIRMEFAALPFVFPHSPRQSVTVILNGVEVARVKLRPGMQRYTVTLPASSLREGLDELEFRYAYARAPRDVLAGSPDVRLLGVAWYSIDFAPEGR